MGNAVAIVIPGKWDWDERDVRRIQWLFDVGSTLGCRENYFRCFFFSFLESDYFCSVLFWMNTLLPGLSIFCDGNLLRNFLRGFFRNEIQVIRCIIYIIIYRMKLLLISIVVKNIKFPFSKFF